MTHTETSRIGSGYVDLQVNGTFGVDFNGHELTAESLHHACARLQEDGAAAFLPTVVTDKIDVMAARLSRLAKARQADPLARSMILGFHIEGPFISDAPGFVGAHPREFVRPANVPEMERLLEAADGLAVNPRRTRGARRRRRPGRCARRRSPFRCGRCSPPRRWRPRNRWSCPSREC